MGDLFHESVPDEWIDRVFAVMALSPQHTFQVLTKRPVKMRDVLTADDVRTGIYNQADHLCEAIGWPRTCSIEWPLPNVWLGVSAEDQTRADERIPDLLATPAAIRFVSAEPLLGAINIADAMMTYAALEVLFGKIERGEREPRGSLNWIIAGGESGPGARPMHPDWARSIRDQCQAAGMPFFMKQMSGAVKARMPPIPSDLMVREFPK